MRRVFQLPEEDQDYLNSLDLEWETISSNGNWVLIHEHPVPKGYNLSTVTVALKIDGGYPSAQIDMVYFCPALEREDKRQIRALASIQFDNKAWQRWSRHRTGQNPWRPELDGIDTQMGLVGHWLEREFQIR